MAGERCSGIGIDSVQSAYRDSNYSGGSRFSGWPQHGPPKSLLLLPLHNFSQRPFDRRYCKATLRDARTLRIFWGRMPPPLPKGPESSCWRLIVLRTFFCTFCLQEDQSDPAEELEELFEAAQRHKTAGEFERAMAGFECVLRNEMTRSELGFRALAQLYQIAMEQVLHQRLSVVFRLNPHL